MIESAMMNLLLCLPGQVVHANLRRADVAWFPTGTERGRRPSQICVNLLSGLRCFVIFTPCFRVSVVSLFPCFNVFYINGRGADGVLPQGRT
jgi:hypothetical protein